MEKGRGKLALPWGSNGGRRSSKGDGEAAGRRRSSRGGGGARANMRLGGELERASELVALSRVRVFLSSVLGVLRAVSSNRNITRPVFLSLVAN